MHSSFLEDMSIYNIVTFTYNTGTRTYKRFLQNFDRNAKIKQTSGCDTQLIMQLKFINHKIYRKKEEIIFYVTMF